MCTYKKTRRRRQLKNRLVERNRDASRLKYPASYFLSSKCRVFVDTYTEFASISEFDRSSENLPRGFLKMSGSGKYWLSREFSRNVLVRSLRRYLVSKLYYWSYWRWLRIVNVNWRWRFSSIIKLYSTWLKNILVYHIPSIYSQAFHEMIR